ncbi:MAG TPA: hypothetical protein VLW50_04920 [Streptosporangiaceae bacterium]|nr:hypothetical protein [Streptosporangiaceae bacterium]
MMRPRRVVRAAVAARQGLAGLATPAGLVTLAGLVALTSLAALLVQFLVFSGPALAGPVAASGGAAAALAMSRPELDDGGTDPGCQVRIGEVRLAGFRDHGRWLHAADVSAYLACKHPVRDMSLQVTLWKVGLFYDHRQAQSTAKAVAGSHLGSDLTRVACKDETASRFYGVAQAVVYFRGKRGDAWVRSPGTSTPRCGT